MSTPAPAYDALAVAHELDATLRARADEIERARQLPADLSQLLAARGLYRWWVPERYGGLEVPLVPAMQAIEQLARADGSVAWCVFIAITSATTVAFLPEAAARQIFSAPETLVGGVFAPNGRGDAAAGGFRVTGRWPFGSGTLNADWVCAGTRFFRAGEPILGDDGAPRQHMVLVPASAVDFLDTWKVSGLCGTGSTDFRLQEVLVAEDHIVAWHGERVERPLYVFPQFTLLCSGFGPIALGLARSAIDELVEIAIHKSPVGSQRSLATRHETQAAVARAQARWRAARAFLYEAAECAWDAACDTGDVRLELRRDLRLATSHAVHEGAAIVDTMYTLAGSSSIYRQSPLQRIFRDIHVVTQHMMVRGSTFEVAGRTLLGIDQDAALL